MKKSLRFILTICASLALIAGLGTPANAAQPPPGYPSHDIMDTAQHPTLGPIPIHRGFYDGDLDQGFGMDKAYHKHNIWTVSAMKKVMVSPNYFMGGNGNYNLTAYAGHYECESTPGVCVLSDQRELRGVHDGRTYQNYYNWPVNGLMGQLTLYCINPGGARLCPNWVTFAIDNPGVTNPYKPGTMRSEVDPNPTATLGASQPQSSGDPERTNKKLAEPESQKLLTELDKGTTALEFSYEPLPQTIPNLNK